MRVFLRAVVLNMLSTKVYLPSASPLYHLSSPAWPCFQLSIATRSHRIASTSTPICAGVKPVATKPKARAQSRPVMTRKAALELSRKDWLTALSSPEHPLSSSVHTFDGSEAEAEPPVFNPMPSGPAGCVPFVGSSGVCVLGIDPDVSGAIAVLRGDDIDTAEVFDVPNIQVIVGTKNRRRHDARSIVALINRINVPHGSVAYVEQSTPIPKDGKQGWWGSGFGFGMWIGVLVASGFSVVPVPPVVWRRAMDFTGKIVNKDDCRVMASSIFPRLASKLQRKKDHGRAEALLIAAYGKGIPAPLAEGPENGEFPIGLVQEEQL